MGLVLYNIFLFLFRIGVRVAAVFSPKAKQWLAGRQGIWQRLAGEMHRIRGKSGTSSVVWVHCASLGEFEQGRPIIEALKRHYPGTAIVLSFFSPSGYEIRKGYPGAELVTYLPLDGGGNARKWLELIRPDLVIFVKYEFWYYYLRTLHQNKIPVLLVSAIFRKDSIFFKWYGSLHRQMLTFFHQLLVQNEESHVLLKNLGLGDKTRLAGDSRFDRVAEIAGQSAPLPIIENFIAGAKTLVAGSTWPADETLLQKTLWSRPGLKLIIAPHEIGTEHLSQLKQLFPKAVLYSALKENNAISGDEGVLIIDNIGMLSRLYHYAYITYVGGGFGKGIHNTLEAAVHGKPILFGPAYHKFQEAKDLIALGAATEINNEDQCGNIVDTLMNDTKSYEESCAKARNYVQEKTGATGKIIQFVQENRLLTR